MLFQVPTLSCFKIVKVNNILITFKISYSNLKPKIYYNLQYVALTYIESTKAVHNINDGS